MESKWLRTLMAIAVAALVGCCAFPTSTPAPVSSPTPVSQPTSAPVEPATVAPTPLPVEPGGPPAGDPFALVSQESMFSYLEDLTSIQPYSGWRNSGSEGEQEALDYVEGKLGELQYLRGLGLEVERQTFRVFMATELWETRLHLVVHGQEVEMPASGLRGPRDGIAQTLRFDSDGNLNDTERNPVVVEGPVVLVKSSADVSGLTAQGLQGKVVFVDYAAVDRSVLDQEAMRVASDLLSKGPAGLVLVTRFSNEPGASHGTFVGDVSAFNFVEIGTALPILYVRLEDLAPAGIRQWEDLGRVKTARLTWDADVLSPARSGNVVARIPPLSPPLAGGGGGGMQAVILSAHVDSPNSPGALDDGSGSAVLLEVARVLDAARVQPATDLYLVWFGSEEIGIYGSGHFAATHQELLDRTLAMLQMDMLSHPLDGLPAELTLTTWSYALSGDGRLPWPDYLAQAAARRGIETQPVDEPGLESDNGAVMGFNVPNANLIYRSEAMEQVGPLHYAAHVHDPYDTVDLAREEGQVLEQMAQVALAAALDTGRDAPDLRVVPQPQGRALFVASHTEAVQMAPTGFIELGKALGMAGLDVDMLPYGQAVTPADLEHTDLVVVLPVLDYPSPEGDPNLYDEAWSAEEVAALEGYVAGGGLLVLTNSAYRLKLGNTLYDPNEDVNDANALAERFGISYGGTLPGAQARAAGKSPLVAGIGTLRFTEGNGVAFTMAEGQVLAQANGKAVVGLVDYGDGGGQVLVLADVGLLGAQWVEPLRFWQNLAEYARSCCQRIMRTD